MSDTPFHPLVSTMHRRNFCARYMLGVSGDGIIPVKEGNDKLFRATLQRNFKFWNSIMVFLFTERTDDDMEWLLCDLDQCSCRLLDPSVRKAHQNGRKWEKDIWYRTCPDKPWRPSISLAVNFFRLLMTALNQARREKEIPYLAYLSRRSHALWT